MQINDFVFRRMICDFFEYCDPNGIKYHELMGKTWMNGDTYHHSISVNLVKYMNTANKAQYPYNLENWTTNPALFTWLHGVNFIQNTMNNDMEEILCNLQLSCPPCKILSAIVCDMKQKKLMYYNDKKLDPSLYDNKNIPISQNIDVDTCSKLLETLGKPLQYNRLEKLFVINRIIYGALTIGIHHDYGLECLYKTNDVYSDPKYIVTEFLELFGYTQFRVGCSERFLTIDQLTSGTLKKTKDNFIIINLKFNNQSFVLHFGYHTVNFRKYIVCVDFDNLFPQVKENKDYIERTTQCKNNPLREIPVSKKCTIM